MSKTDRALLFTYLRPLLPRFLLLAFVLFAGIGLQLANPLVAKTFIDQAAAGEPFEALMRTAAIFLGVALATQAAVVAETFAADDLGWRATNALRADLTRHVLALDGSFHAQRGAGELIERIDGDVGAIRDFFSRFVLHVMGNALFLLGVLVLLFLQDWRIGSLLAAFVLGAFLYMTRGGGFVGRRARDTRAAAADLSSYLEERLGALPDLKASGADSYAMRGFHERSAASYRRIAASAMAGTLFNGTIGLFFVIGSAGALALGAAFFSGGAITLGGVFLVFRYTGMLRMPIERLARQMDRFQRATGGIVRVRELLSTRSRVVDGPPADFPGGALSVELDDVWFAYEDETVLRSVSFRIRPGEVLGLLGRTGSGKTTIGRLLFRLYDPSSGAVRIGGVDARNARLDDLRARIGLVTQDVQLFDGTLRDNVTLFDPAVRDERLGEVFAELDLQRWLHTLPEGLDTRLGAAGRGLSAGEAQLVAFARVFLRDPGLVILDEASSRLDPATERLLEHAVTRLLDGRTAVVIAHRLSTVDRADRLVILEDGEVVEQGRRVELASDERSRFSSLRRAGMAEVLA